MLFTSKTRTCDAFIARCPVLKDNEVLFILIEMKAAYDIGGLCYFVLRTPDDS